MIPPFHTCPVRPQPFSLWPRGSSSIRCSRSHFGVKYIAWWHPDRRRAHDARILLSFFQAKLSQQVVELNNQPDVHQLTSFKCFGGLFTQIYTARELIVSHLKITRYSFKKNDFWAVAPGKHNERHKSCRDGKWTWWILFAVSVLLEAMLVRQVLKK